MDRYYPPHKASYRPKEIIREIYQLFVESKNASDAAASIYLFALIVAAASAVVNNAYPVPLF